jgi:excisionase family DNA binding protein
MDQLIDIITLSKLLSVKPMTIYGWIHEGVIPFIKLGRLVRFSEKEVQAWLNKKKREGQSVKTADIDLT